MKTIKLIKADINANNNKYWAATLNDDGTIDAEFGRVGTSPQRITYGAYRGGASFFDRKVREKNKKGYKEARVVVVNEQKTAQVSNLQQVAQDQIDTGGDPLVAKLIARLAKENVHKITSSTNITFNEDSGLFQTPMGIVTPDAITEARDLLVKITPKVLAQKWDGSFSTDMNEYLMLIPQNIGAKKFNPDSFFHEGQDSLVKQSDILDSLDASYLAASKAPPKKGVAQTPEEKVFDLKLAPVSNAEVERIRKLYQKTRKAQHVCHGLNVTRAFEVTMAVSKEAFNPDGLDNVWELWHGTNIANLLSILKSGIKITPPSTARIAGKMFGPGAYFSDQSTKSLNYAYGYWSGGRNSNCFMFLADVAMGNFHRPTRSTSSLPPKGSHSYFAEAKKSGVMNNEMIVFNNNQINLTKLVEFS